MTGWSRRIPFQVDIAGIIEIMGGSLYSRLDTAIRELIQNGHDAVIRRRQVDLGYHGRIDIEQDAAGTLRFTDDGIGLSAEEAERYLGTLGIGLTGLIKQARSPGGGPAPAGPDADLIGQFGVGLWSAFMLAERIVVETRRAGPDSEPVRWEAGPEADIVLSAGQREAPGTTVLLHLKPEHHALAEDEALLEAAVRRHADFIPVPIHLNGSGQRLNVINVAWFDASPDPEAIELAIEHHFSETPLDVIPIRRERPVSIAGALYVTPQRVPGFSDQAVVMVTVRRMIISRRIQELLPPWAAMIRGVLELRDCAPTASREDLVRNGPFGLVREVLAEHVYEHFERLARDDPDRMESILAWHRYTFAGAALDDRRLRDLLRRTYRWPTSRGVLSYEQIAARSGADPIHETEAERVLWYHTERRQERWISQLFAGHDVPCVHALRSFEESLLAALVADDNEDGTALTDLRYASPTAPGLAESVLGLRELEDAAPEWQSFLDATGATILCASFDPELPVLAFLDEKSELRQTFDELRQRGTIPAGFQRIIDTHFEGDDDERARRHQVVLNRRHRLVSRALAQSPRTPLASVLRLLVLNALTAAGASIGGDAARQQRDDLDWIAEAL